MSAGEEKKLQGMLADPSIPVATIIEYVKENFDIGTSLKPMTLGMLFERYASIVPGDNNYFSREITIDELCENIHPSFRSTNGNQWARRDSSYLGKQYIIRVKHGGGRVYSLQLDGPNKQMGVQRSIRSDIRKSISSQVCPVFGTSSNIEVDHKDGRYDNWMNASPDTQREEDFQPLSKAANDAKRTHCKRCRESGKRYDARALGFSRGWISGDEDTPVCDGCYWHDVRKFHQKISEIPFAI